MSDKNRFNPILSVSLPITLERWQNGGWTLTQRGSGGELVAKIASFSDTRAMLDGLSEMLTVDGELI